VFERSLAPLVAFVRVRLGPALAARESATDLAQSVCREVLEDLDDLDYRGETAFRGWLYQQAVRKILDRDRYYHRERRDIGREVSPAGPEDDFDALAQCYVSICSPSDHVAAREQLAKVESAIASLPEPQRDAVTMSRLMGLGYAEIAEVMGCSESAVRGLTARGLTVVSATLADS